MFKKNLLGLFIFMSAGSLMGMQQESHPSFYTGQQHAVNIVMQKRYQWLQTSLFLLPAAALAAIIYKATFGRGIDLFEGVGCGVGFSALYTFTQQTFNIIGKEQERLSTSNKTLRDELEKYNKKS